MQSLRHLVELEGPRAAVFDADGVLWRGDVSEDFTRWMIDRGQFDGDLWAGYEADNARDSGVGCLSMLKFYAGIDLGELERQVEEFWRSGGERRWIDLTLESIRWLTESGFSVYVVSGTPRPVLTPLTRILPIPPERILALELDVDEDQRATGCAQGIPTHGAGKVLAIRDATSDPIYLAAGNSHIDIDMLELSIDLRWAIEPDDQLRAVATRENWTIIDDPETTP